LIALEEELLQRNVRRIDTICKTLEPDDSIRGTLFNR